MHTATKGGGAQQGNAWGSGMEGTQQLVRGVDGALEDSGKEGSVSGWWHDGHGIQAVDGCRKQ